MRLLKTFKNIEMKKRMINKLFNQDHIILMWSYFYVNTSCVICWLVLPPLSYYTICSKPQMSKKLDEREIIAQRI